MTLTSGSSFWYVTLGTDLINEVKATKDAVCVRGSLYRSMTPHNSVWQVEVLTACILRTLSDPGKGSADIFLCIQDLQIAVSELLEKKEQKNVVLG